MLNLPVPAVKDQADLGERPVPRQPHQKSDEWLLSLLYMWNVEKLSTSQIAGRLGITRSTVAGQITRHRAVGFENRPRKGRQVPKKPFKAKPNRSKFNPPDKKTMHHIAVAAKPMESEPLVIVDTWWSSSWTQINELGSHNCRWPVDGYGHNMWYCGETTKHTPYCTGHTLRAAR